VNVPEHDAAEALRLAKEVHEAVMTILKRLDATSKYARRNRIIGILAVVVGLLSAVVVGIGGYGVYEIHRSQIHSCEIGNDARASQLTIWDEVLNLSSKPPKNETPAQRAARLKQVRQFQAFLNLHLQQVNCDQLYSGIFPKNLE